MEAFDYFKIALIVGASALAVVVIYKILKIILTPLRILIRIILALIAFAVLAHFIADHFGYDLLGMLLKLIEQPSQEVII